MQRGFFFIKTLVLMCFSWILQKKTVGLINLTTNDDTT
jgi:hypothetical protein